MKRKVWLIIGALFLIPIISFAFFNPLSCGISLPAKQAKSLSNLRQICLTLRVYASDYDNQLPTNFSLLIPEYIDTDDVFYHPRNPFGHQFKTFTTGKPSPKKTARILLVDSLSSYRLLHLPHTNWAILHEAPHTWEDGRMAWISLEKTQKGEWYDAGNIRGSFQEFEAAILSKLKTAPPSKTIIPPFTTEPR